MPTLLVIRLIPKDPVPASEFEGFLQGLSIDAHQLSIADPAGQAPPVGSAAYLPPVLPPSPSADVTPQPDANTRITQHFGIDPAGVGMEERTMFSVATAVIVIPDPPPGGEHETTDVRLVITRNGTEVVHRRRYYNVPVSSDALPGDPNDFPALSPDVPDDRSASLYLHLPAPGTATGPTVVVPEDGGAPPYQQLRDAVETVLNAEPGNLAGIGDLTLEDARHVAREIVWDQAAAPLISPSRPLDELYTGPHAANSDEERDRRIFEGDLITYYVSHDGEADRLSAFVFALSAAIWCEDRSDVAREVGFVFPVFPDEADRWAKVHLTHPGGAALDPAFRVPAQNFYALTAVLPPQVPRHQRYDMVVLESVGQATASLTQAVDDGLITETVGVDRFQAARRLWSLGLAAEPNVAECPLQAGSDAQGLVTDWLAVGAESTDAFWTGLTASQTAGHLELALCAVTHAHSPLMAAIIGPFGVGDIGDLAGKSNQQWASLFESDPGLLPPFTAPGSVEERTEAFLRGLRRFFNVVTVIDPPAAPSAGDLPQLERSPGNPLDQLLALMPGFAFTGWDPGDLAAALEVIFPDDPTARADFAAWLVCVRDALTLTEGITPEALRFSVTEALWARGLVKAEDLDGKSLETLGDLLRGSVAFDHAQTIWDNAEAGGALVEEPPGDFTPVNPDGSLTNCIPAKHLSPLGPVAYLKDLLRISEAITCEDPLPEDQESPLEALLATRRGLLGELLASPGNVCTPIPVIDIVNESLEHMVASGAGAGVVRDTAEAVLGGHALSSAAEPEKGAHDAAALFCALPEHSTPATPTAEPGAWDVLRQDFSACVLPYHQPIDVARTYLSQAATSRFEVMRAFRRHITEFVLDPDSEPADFLTHLWRYPVRHALALEYLCVTPEEYAVLYSPGGVGAATLSLHYGFPPAMQGWMETVTHLPEFLERTCLSYCEFLELWRAGFVGFDVRHRRERDLPDCEPCCLDEYTIVFTDPADPPAALKLLNAFIRLWRRLNHSGHPWSFAELADAAEVLEMFHGTTANPDFVRELAALQMLRDTFELPMTNGTAPGPGDTGAERTHLLALWVPGAAKFDWAVDLLLDRIQRYAIDEYRCACRPPEFLKLLRDNLDPISMLAGFDPDDADDAWQAHPTHTLRLFADILVKLYASDFQVGEILFLFTTDPQLQGGDLFPAQTDNEARDLPFSLPDDDEQNSLFALRKCLLAVDPGEGDGWTWTRMGEMLHTRFGMPMPPDSDRWPHFGAHFFPGVLEAEGTPVAVAERRYEVPLPATSTDMWNTGPGPFRYDPAGVTLGLQIGFTDVEVIAKLARIRQLSPQERAAVSDLYHLPREDLAFFSFLFDSQLEAEARLIQEPDETERWRWFRLAFVRFVARCDAIAEHLAAHLKNVTGRAVADGAETAALVLRHLWAAENLATAPWENDNGQVPPVTWGPQPNGGAFHALLGVVGTGMLAEYRSTTGLLRWREVRGGMDAFGGPENAANAPVPTVIPAMNATFTAEQLHYAAIRNGFAVANDDGEALGGAEPFVLAWQGLLLIEETGTYGFAAGAPTEGIALPDFEALRRFHRWRVRLKQGQRTWELLRHDDGGAEAPPDCAAPIRLERGFYDLSVELERLPLHFDGPEDVCPQTTGFQLKYDGPDAGGKWMTIPNDKLFVGTKDGQMHLGLDTAVTGGGILDFLSQHYVSTVRDMRRTYQMAFKAMLFAHRLDLRSAPVADDGQSELGYMLSQPTAFRGQSYYRDGGIQTHRADFDFNLLPLLDNYLPPAATDDMRVAPTPQRMQALFDWWERLFDWTVMRAATGNSKESPAWLGLHESEESHEDHPAHLQRHWNVDVRHDDLVLQYFDPAEGDLSYDVTSNDLIDDRWAVRVWRADLWVQELNRTFLSRDIRTAQPFLWASDGPEPDGLANLTRFYRDGCIENGDPRRYVEFERLNNGLRERGRVALIAWLTRMNRVPLPWGGFAMEPRDLSDLLLIDVEAGICQKAARIEEAISAVQLFVNRARLGLEDGLAPPPEFLHAWDRRFADFRRWQACKRREIYRENWIEWDKVEAARHSEGFRFFESELRRADLTLPVPGGLVRWAGERPPAHPGLALLQGREPSTMAELAPPRQGLGLLGTPDRHARPSWLAPLYGAPDRDDGPSGHDTPVDSAPDRDDDVGSGPQAEVAKGLPMWFEAAVRLGTKFLRAAAAGRPPVTTGYVAKCDATAPAGCCAECGESHPATMDEYYFWLETSELYRPVEQVAEWGAVPDDPMQGTIGDPKSDWHRPEELPGLLAWPPRRSVHLRWCRVHHGEFQTPRKSAEGVELAGGTVPDIELTGRTADSLSFAVAGGVARTGHPADPLQPFPPPGFRYDLADDDAVVLPEVVTTPDPAPVGGLPAFPFFGWHDPGAPILPPDPFAMAVAAAGHLATHCRYEEALRWLALVWPPLQGDNTWSDCGDHDDGGDDVDVEFGDTGVGDSTVPTLPRGRSRRCCCPSDPVSDSLVARRHVTMCTLDMLLDWGDALMRRNTPESFGHARLLADTVHRILGHLPETVVTGPDGGPFAPVSQVQLACPPLNPRLMCLYTRTEDRLGLIRACLNEPRLTNGVPNVDMPFAGTDTVRECWKIDGDACLDRSFWCRPASPYRFVFLVSRAQELAAELRGLGAQLLSAYEKGDAEYLSQLRVLHERQINDLMLSIREDQWREADWQVQVLEKAKAAALTNLTHYRNLVAAGLLSGEAQYEPLTVTSTTLRSAGNVVEAIGQAMNLVPDPNVGFPTNFLTLPPGKKLAMIFSASGMIARTAADIVTTMASLGLTNDGWIRRADEWEHLVDIHTIEVDQIARQMLGAHRRRDAALRELNAHRQAMQNAAEVQDFLRDKFTSHALYLWLQKETAALHHRMYELALHCAWQTQRAYNLERGHTAERFITDEAWDHLHEGLLSGERLSLALRRMEKAYHDRNLREYEITKHISLREQFPTAFLQLQAIGHCEVTIPEWMFDLDYPGHYMRRIRNLAVSIPCVIGPYTGVHCRVTLLSSETRVSPELLENHHGCCTDEGCNNGYKPLPEDSRVVKSYAATEAFVTSTAQNDTGLFELNLQDPRYLPFEAAGAVCRLRLEMPAENNHFDLDTLRDCVLHLRYTAREGGDRLREVARDCARTFVPGNGQRLIDARRETGGQWRSVEGRRGRTDLLGLPLTRSMLPFLTGDRQVVVNRLEVLFEAPEAMPSTHRTVTFFAGQRLQDLDPDTCKEGVHSIDCVGDAAWPGFYHGALALESATIPGSGPLDVGVLQFPAETGRIRDCYVLFGYSAGEPGASAVPAEAGYA